MAKSRGFGGIIITLLVLGALGYGGWYFYSKKTTKEIEYSTAQVKRAVVTQAITATGALQTIRTIDVSTLVSGEVVAIYKDFNDTVVAGDPLLDIDPAPYQLKLDQAKASYASTMASTSKSIADAERTKGLFKLPTPLVTQQDFDAAETSILQAKAQRLTSQASLDQAELDLKRTKIVAPEAGVVLNRTVEKGKTVNSSQSSQALFTLINDLTKLQISADVSEADIGNAKEGQQVLFTVDAFPNRSFSGMVRQVRNAAKTSNSVVSYTCIIDVPNDDRTLRVGMTASLQIVIATRPADTLVVPNSALRTKIPDEVTTEMNKRKAAGGTAAAATPTPVAQNGAGQGNLGSNIDPGTMVGGDPTQAANGRGGRGQGGGRGGAGGGGRGGARGGVTVANVAVGAGLNVSTIPRTVYKLVTDAAGKKLPEAVSIRLGISDGTNTEILPEFSGGLKEGDQLVTFVTMPGSAAAQKAQAATQTTNPFGTTGQTGRGGGGGGAGGGGGGRGGGF